MLKLLALAATLGALGGAGGGTLAATVHKKGKGPHTKPQNVAIAFGQAKAITVPALGLAAGDRLQRPFDLKNAGKKPWSAVALTTSASPDGPLVTDAVNGLQLRIDLCPTAWKPIRQTPVFGCTKRIVTVLGPRPLLGSGMQLAGIAGLAKGKSVHLLLTLALPGTAPNRLQGQTAAVSYTFTAL